MWIFAGSYGCSLVQKLPEFTCGEAASIPRLLLRLGVGFRLQSLSSRKPAIISSTWRPFQECLENMRKSRNWWCGWFRGFFFRSSSSDTSASTSISFPESFATCFGDLLDSLHIFKIQIATNVNLYPDVNINISWILFFIPLLRCARRPDVPPWKGG